MNALFQEESRFAAVDRRFWLFLALSLGLHAAVLAWRMPNHEVPILPPILATLRLVVAPPSVAPATPTPGPTAALPAQPAPAVVPKQAKQRPPPPERLSARAAAVAAAPPTMDSSAAATVAAEPAPSQPVASVVANPAPPVAAAPAQPQANLLAAYRQRLTEIFASQQQYPRVAAMRGWEGEVRLRVRIARKGNLLAVHLDHSSGFDVLDQHALAMLETLSSLPPLPEGLEANEIQVVVPVNYKLKKTT